MKNIIFLVAISLGNPSCITDFVEGTQKALDESKEKEPSSYKDLKIYKPNDKGKIDVIDFPDEDAQFPGGFKTMSRWISAQIEYPEEAIEKGEEGKVFLSFTVLANGRVHDLFVERGVTYSLDYEAYKVIQKMPKWIPGRLNGKAVSTRVRLPISFKLD